MVKDSSSVTTWYTEIVSGRTVVVGGGLKEDGWKPDNFVVDSNVYIITFIVEFCGMSLTYLFVTLIVVNYCWYYFTICRCISSARSMLMFIKKT